MADLRSEKLTAFGANVSRCRRARKLTQASLATLVELEPRMIRAIEGGRAAPSFASIVALAAALEVHEGELFAPLTAANPKRRPGRPRKDET